MKMIRGEVRYDRQHRVNIGSLAILNTSACLVLIKVRRKVKNQQWQRDNTSTAAHPAAAVAAVHFPRRRPLRLNAYNGRRGDERLRNVTTAALYL